MKRDEIIAEKKSMKGIFESIRPEKKAGICPSPRLNPYNIYIYTYAYIHFQEEIVAIYRSNYSMIQLPVL